MSRPKYILDDRPKALEWEEEFGLLHWKDPQVDDKMAQESLLVLMNCLKGRKVPDEARKAAEFVAGNKAWPSIKNPQTVNINVLRLEDLEAAKLKAGLTASPKQIQSSPSKSSPSGEDIQSS